MRAPYWNRYGSNYCISASQHLSENILTELTIHQQRSPSWSTCQVLTIGWTTHLRSSVSIRHLLWKPSHTCWECQPWGPDPSSTGAFLYGPTNNPNTLVSKPTRHHMLNASLHIEPHYIGIHTQLSPRNKQTRYKRTRSVDAVVDETVSCVIHELLC